MEQFSLFGIPYPIIGFVCFLLAGVFMLVWPKSKAKDLQTLNFPKFVLHYFHPLAWVLIGMAAFMQRAYPELATVVAGLGILAFGMFIFIFFRS
jgi:tryptophan-rich sensory protein